jgi:hypothetical protein
VKTSLRSFLEAISKVEIKLLTGTELYDKFARNNKEQADVEKRIRYLSWADAKNEDLLIAYEGEKIIGVAGIQTALTKPWASLLIANITHQKPLLLSKPSFAVASRTLASNLERKHHA